MQNSSFNKFYQNIDFESISSEDVKFAASQIIQQSKAALSQITEISKVNRTFANTLGMLDTLYSDLSDIESTIYLIGFVHPNAEIRAEAQQEIAKLEKFGNELSMNEELFIVVKEFSETEEANLLTGFKKRFLWKTIKNFERSGFLLSKGKRDELKILKDKLADIGLAFDTNISEFSDALFVSDAEITGLPEDYKKLRKQENGSYKINLSYPSYRPFMQLSESESARKQLYLKFSNRAKDANLPVLLEMIRTRTEIAHILGFSSFAAFQLDNKMAKTTANVWNFEKDLQIKVKEKAKLDYAELLEIKNTLGAKSDAIEIINWEASFVSNLLMKEKYQVDNQKVKEYFELGNVIKGLFTISEILFEIKFLEQENPSVWHEDVRFYSISINEKTIAHFYLDLFPRENKYGHAACFPMHCGRKTSMGYKKPLASLVCNFSKPTDEKPSLLPHDDVVTFFHEFGHLLHSLLTTSELGSMAGTAVSNDFVETPSQLFENWAWNYDALKIFAQHYQSNEILPKDLYDKMWAARNVGSGISALQQIFYGQLDMTFYDKFNPDGLETTTEIVKKLQNEITLYPYVDGTHMETSFGHLNGYASGYYGYLWALVYAQDIFSVFEKEGILNSKIGLKYLELILSKGSTEDEFDITKQFLGREPSSFAFLKSLGL